MTTSNMRVCIIGAGASGLSLAHALSSPHIELLICDAGKAGHGAIAASAGMIAPGAEAIESLDPSRPRHQDFYRLARHSAALWEGWAAHLGAKTGTDIAYRRCGALIPASDPAPLAAIAGGFGIASESAGARWPDLAPARAGLILPEEARLDPRALAAALQISVRQAGARVQEDTPVAGIVFRHGRAAGVRLEDGREIGADCVVIAAGWAGAHLHRAAGDLQPVKGQILLFDAGRDLSRWPLIRGEGVYLVPGPAGHVLVGASVEPGRSDTQTDSQAASALMARARALVPELAEWRLVDHWAGVRPSLPDRMPRAGRASDGLYLSIGAHRNGILLAPAIAGALAREIMGQGPDELLAPFAPNAVNESLSSAR